LKVGSREAGTQNRHGNARAIHFFVHALTERSDERLRGRVGSVQGARLVRRERRHIEDAALAALDHRSRGRVGQPHERHNIEVDLANLGFDLELGEAAKRPEAGVVHQDVDRASPRFDGGKLRGVGEVGGQDFALHIE
jgi:hypothetical protein